MTQTFDSTLDDPREIGPYRDLVLLGSGGFGSVYRATGPDGQRVALKRLDVSGLRNRQRFDQEWALLQRVVHPNVVRVLDRLEHDGHPVLVLEYVDGPDLDLAIRHHHPRHLRLTQVHTLLTGIVIGVRAAHRQKVVHRDLKPANILLERQLYGTVVPKVCDFGLAKDTERVEGLTIARGPLGTLNYMAPEQHVGERATAAADLYGIGCILYEMLCGERAFPGNDAEQIHRRKRDAGYVPVPKLRPDARPGMLRVVERCLAPDPRDRYADCDALLRDWHPGFASAADTADGPSAENETVSLSGMDAADLVPPPDAVARLRSEAATRAAVAPRRPAEDVRDLLWVDAHAGGDPGDWAGLSAQVIGAVVRRDPSDVARLAERLVDEGFAEVDGGRYRLRAPGDDAPPAGRDVLHAELAGALRRSDDLVAWERAAAHLRLARQHVEAQALLCAVADATQDGRQVDRIAGHATSASPPDLPDAHAARWARSCAELAARVHAFRGQWGAAMAAWDTALVVHEDEAQVLDDPDRARARIAHATAVGWLNPRLAATLLGEIGDDCRDRGLDESRLDATVALAALRLRLGDPAGAEREVRAVLADARSVPRARLLHQLAQAQLAQEKRRPAYAAWGESDGILRERGRQLERSEVLAAWAAASVYDDLTGARSRADDARAIAERCACPPALARAQVASGVVCVHEGRYAAAVHALREGARRAMDLMDASTAQLALVSLARAQLEHGDGDAAISTLRDAARLCRTAGGRGDVEMLVRALDACARAGRDRDAARQRLDELQLDQRPGSTRAEVFLAVARAWREIGAPLAARLTAREAQQDARSRGLESLEIEACALLAELTTASERLHHQLRGKELAAMLLSSVSVAFAITYQERPYTRAVFGLRLADAPGDPPDPGRDTDPTELAAAREPTAVEAGAHVEEPPTGATLILHPASPAEAETRLGVHAREVPTQVAIPAPVPATTPPAGSARRRAAKPPPPPPPTTRVVLAGMVVGSLLAAAVLAAAAIPVGLWYGSDAGSAAPREPLRPALIEVAGSADVKLRRDTNEEYGSGLVPPGTYDIIAVFDGEARPQGTIAVDPGERVTYRCDDTTRTCAVDR